MKEKFLRLLLFVPIVLLAQPPADEQTVPIDNYTTPVVLLMIVISYLVLKFKTNTTINNNK